MLVRPVKSSGFSECGSTDYAIHPSQTLANREIPVQPLSCEQVQEVLVQLMREKGGAAAKMIEKRVAQDHGFLRSCQEGLGARRLRKQTVTLRSQRRQQRPALLLMLAKPS